MTLFRTGLDRLSDELAHVIRGKRVGVLCHAASMTRELSWAPFALRGAGAEVIRLLAPEHGPWGTAQYMVAVDGGVDPVSGFEVVSLYGESEASLRPPPEVFVGLDAVIVDVQDVGARYYTYAQTAAWAVQGAVAAGLPAYVCDRPNPLGGDVVEGNRLGGAWASFVGHPGMLQRHGLTVAELVRAYSGGAGTAVRMQSYRRALRWEDTGLAWLPPSPNVPTLDTAVVYPGMCLLEGTNVSEGRGTTTPFLVFGAPFYDPFALAARLMEDELEGVRFVPHVFQPSWDKWAGEACGGVRVVLDDARALEPVRLGIAVLLALKELGGDRFQWRSDAYEFVQDRIAIDLLLGDSALRHRIEEGDALDAVVSGLDAEAEAFRVDRRPWLLYDE